MFEIQDKTNHTHRPSIKHYNKKIRQITHIIYFN